MNHKFENLIKDIKLMLYDPEKIYHITLSDGRASCAGRINEEDIKNPVRLSYDKTKIICFLFKNETVDIMADKLLKAQSLMDDCLEYRRHKEDSPDLYESLYYNIPEFQDDRIF